MRGFPRGWTAAVLEDVTNSIRYGYTATSTAKGNGPHYLRITDIQDGRVDWRSVPHTQEARDQARYVLAEGDIVFARTGATVGKSFLVRSPPPNAIFASYLIRVSVSREVILPEFANAFFQSPDYWVQIFEGASGTGQPNFNGSKLAKLDLPLPPLAEQRRIVAKLDALTSGTARVRADLDRVPALAARYRQAVLAEAFSGQLTADWRTVDGSTLWSQACLNELRDRRAAYVSGRRGSRLRDASPLILPGGHGDLPPTWAAGCLADVADLRVGYAFKSEWFADDGPLLLRGANVAMGSIDWSDARRLKADRASEFAAHLLRAGDIVMAMDRPLISTGLKIAQLADRDAGALLVQRVASPILTALIDGRYAWWLLNSANYIGQIERHATGSDLPHVSGNDILTTPTPLPPVAEQREIARRLDDLFAQIDRMQADAASARRLLDRLDQAILAKAFRGDLVPHDPADEPASALLERIKGERLGSPRPHRRPQQVA